MLFFGLGPETPKDADALWRMTETIVGGKVYKPVVAGTLNLRILGSANMRVVAVGDNTSEPGSALSLRYDDTAAPGLARPHANFAEFSGGLRLQPKYGRLVRPLYAITVDQFISAGSAKSTLSRLTIDLTHQFPLYRTSRSRNISSADLVGPDDCSDSQDGRCGSISRDRDGSITIRFLNVDSWTTTANRVPFYFQPTLGDSDIDGDHRLFGFTNYRFRGPNLIAFQEQFDHSLPLIEPVGFVLIAQQGRVGLTTSDLGLSRARQSLSFGISVRAGGFPEVFLLFGFVREGTTSVSVSINHSSGAPRGLPCSSRVKERRPVLRRHRERTRGFVDIDRADRDLIMIGGVANAAPRFVCTDGGQ